MKNITTLLFRLSFLTVMVLTPIISDAQVEMADGFRGEGKIYVVIAVILVILVGFFYLLYKVDKKSKRLEEEVRDQQD